MNEHIFIVSTMTIELTASVFQEIGIELNISNSIQKFQYNNKQFWIACMHPILLTLSESLLPYVDKCVLLYHKHDILSCLRVENTMRFLNQQHVHIDIISVSQPLLVVRHQSLVRKQYNQIGFLRLFLTGNLAETLKQI